MRYHHIQSSTAKIKMMRTINTDKEWKKYQYTVGEHIKYYAYFGKAAGIP